jgi:hypothetical protein
MNKLQGGFMSKHTPGPWAVYDKERRPNILNPRIISIAPNGVVRKIVADCCVHTTSNNNGVTLQEAVANAKLIAAAPVMKKVIERTIEQLKNNFPDLCDDPNSIQYELISEMSKSIEAT